MTTSIVSFLVCVFPAVPLARPLQDIPYVPEVRLVTGHSMPLLGFGTGRLEEKSMVAISAAVKLGYRLLDTAIVYNATARMSSEAVVGKVIEDSGIPREEFFIVTKIVPQIFGEEECRKAIENSLKFLRTSYIDLVLIHIPVCYFHGCKPTGTYLNGWRSLEALVDEGWIRSIGVSNYEMKEVEETVKIAKHPISVVQNWFDPFEQGKLILEYCKATNITFMGYSTLGGVWLEENGQRSNPVLTSNVIRKIARKNKRSPSQVVLRWATNKGVVVIPGTTKEERMAENLASLTFNVTYEEMKMIDNLHHTDPYEENYENDEL